MASYDDGVWELVCVTAGRPARLRLTADLSFEQLAEIRAHLPKVWRLQRTGEPIGIAQVSGDDFETQRKHIIEASKLRVEILNMESTKAALATEIKILERRLAERKQAAGSFAHALNDVLDNVNIIEKLEQKK